MGVGIAVCSYCWGLNGPESYVNRKILVSGFLMYASYLALFLQFFLNRYMIKTKKL